jgi:hypothetical protein
VFPFQKTSFFGISYEFNLEMLCEQEEGDCW